MKINVNSNEYPNMVVAYLFDKLLHLDTVSPGNKEFMLFMEDMRVRGMLPLARTYYLSMDTKWRVKYKLIKDVFLSDAPDSTYSIINIYADPVKVKKQGIIKTVLKKLLGMKEQFTEEEFNLLLEELDTKEDLLNE